ncbi:hypothetical protein VV99796_01496 [Vibrio vulnificus]|uniref:hypothetical protein n=1 Tax=Vibrio vulnificus TaxID=672 RepID=UPI00092A478A|nr:hypothetical protein [Vibrio vulnificus]OJI28644.1 hypothetical protein VV99796_01496 [Vibrio vulnificus]OJI50867.1 hypothetical protein VVS316_01200 [Vibrio vulnificus]POB08813.1 hypothetical protein CRN33_00740 [Vibrio vulnificus]
MASVVENINVDSDPRFLFDVSFELDIVSNQDDIDLRIDIAKDAVRKGKVEDLKQKRNRFAESNVALSEYEWIDFRDYETCYFVWYFMLLGFRCETNNTKLLNMNLNMDFKTVFANSHLGRITTITVPSFRENNSKSKMHTILYLHYLFSENKVDAKLQKELLDTLKRRYLEFRQSAFFKLTLEDNRDRAQWTESRLENDGIFLPIEIPVSAKAHSLSLAISFFFWDQSSQFSINTSGEEHIVGKSVYVHKLNLSWNQYKHREKNKLKKVKAYSFEMEESLQKKIDHLSKALDMKKNRLIEYLIEQEYTKQTKK